MNKYAVCQNGRRVTVKRTDRNNDFGRVLVRCATIDEAKTCAKLARIEIKSNSPQGGAGKE